MDKQCGGTSGSQSAKLCDGRGNTSAKFEVSADFAVAIHIKCMSRAEGKDGDSVTGVGVAYDHQVL
jgi:hypothetical protein